MADTTNISTGNAAPHPDTGPESRPGSAFSEDVEAELTALRRRVAELESSEASRRREWEQLQLSEEHYRAAVDNVAEAIVVNVGTRRVFANNAFLDLHGIDDISEAEGLGLDHFILPEDRPRVSEWILARQKGEPNLLSSGGIHEYRIRKASGELRTVEASAAAIRFDGQPATLAVLRDITARKQAEEEVVRLASIVESSDDAIIGETLEGIITSWNSGAQRIYGYPAAEVEGKHISLLDPPGLEADVPNTLDTIREGRHVDNFETVRRRWDGRLIDVSLTISPVKNAYGEIVGASTIARDITERKRAEQEEHRRSQEMATLFSLANILAQTEHFEEKVAHVLETLAQISQADSVSLRVPDENAQGLKAVAAAGPAVQDLPTGVLSYTDSVSGTAYQHGEPVIVNDYPSQPLASPLGIERGVKSLAALPVKTGGRTIGLVIIYSRVADFFTPERIRFLTTVVGGLGTLLENARLHEELELRAEELARSNDDLEQFAYAASHDLQEPLRMVSSYVQILAEDYKGQLDESADRFIGYAVDGANRMKGLIDDLLAYSRVGTQGAPFESTDFNAILEQVIYDLEGTIEDSGASLSQDRLPTVDADPIQMSQVLQNLIGNALKFGGDGSPNVHISSEERPEEWVLSVRDDGIGIAPHHYERIFKMFQRLHHRSEYEGSGIGLALCHKIVQRHGGRIWVESELGKGSTFYFSIPKTPDLGLGQETSGEVFDNDAGN